MKEERKSTDYLRDILEYSGKISDFIIGASYEKFSADEKTIWAVIRGLEIIGEAARNVSPELRKKYSSIPWRDITGMRDRLIHDYGSVNLRIVWNAASKELPSLEPQIRQILDELGG